jgi:hypothetical protein
MTTPIRISSSSLREGRWYEYVIRFALGGAATVFTGIISSRYGASVGGLFLALPAIFCASATLIESMKFGASAKRVSAAYGADRKPQHSTPSVPPSEPLECSPSPECSCAWSSAASSPPSLQPRWPGSSSRWRPGSFGGS